MKKVLSWVGKQLLATAVYGGLLLAAASMLLAFAYYEGHRADTSSKEFAITSLGYVSRQWTVASLETLATPQLRNQIADSPDEFAHAIRDVSALGPLVTVDQIRGQAFYRFNVGADNQVTASYQSDATFANGSARVSMCLERIQDQWRIHCISINRAG